jgi:hypothetical protein
MKIAQTDSGYSIKCSREELSVLGNALNNIPQAVSEQDYSSLIGTSKAEVNALLDIIVARLNADTTA